MADSVEKMRLLEIFFKQCATQMQDAVFLREIQILLTKKKVECNFTAGVNFSVGQP